MIRAGGQALCGARSKGRERHVLPEADGSLTTSCVALRARHPAGHAARRDTPDPRPRWRTAHDPPGRHHRRPRAPTGCGPRAGRQALGRSARRHARGPRRAAPGCCSSRSGRPSSSSARSSPVVRGSSPTSWSRSSRCAAMPCHRFPGIRPARCSPRTCPVVPTRSPASTANRSQPRRSRRCTTRLCTTVAKSW